MRESSPNAFGPRDDFSVPPEAAVADERLRALQDALEVDYVSLVRRLGRVLRSQERARDAVHDAYVKLGNAPKIGEVHNPFAYLYRMALNLAQNGAIREARAVSITPESFLALRDEAPDPERVALARGDYQKLLHVLGALPKRRRDIFLARWRDEFALEEIAAQFGLHKRTVQKELVKAELALHSSSQKTNEDRAF